MSSVCSSYNELNDPFVSLSDIDIEAEVALAAGRAKGVKPKELAKIWRIKEEDAKRTIDCTTQREKARCRWSYC